MPLFTDAERNLAAAMAQVAFTNPFLPERIELERRLLGDQFIESGADWNVDTASHAEHPNIERLRQKVEALLSAAQPRLVTEPPASPQEMALFEGIVLLVLYYRYRHAFQDVIEHTKRGQKCPTVRFYDDFAQDATRLTASGAGTRWALLDELPTLFATFYQIRRAFFAVFDNIIGVSRPIVRLRASIWQSLFTHDMRRYRRSLYKRSNDITTLVTGPSGTGKELVARAIALSRFIPFDDATHTFNADFSRLFLPLNIMALAPTLVESELFGHKRGSFTGAVADRTGWLEVCPPVGSVFLDEIGELDAQVQVKLLRVLEQRSFTPIGDTQPRLFEGKLIAATNRDLGDEIAAGRFRTDLYYRLCSDTIATPTLREQLRDDPVQLSALVLFICLRLVGDEEAEALTEEVTAWIERELGPDYDWPGNVRELEQCVRNVLIRGAYRPVGERKAGRDGDWLAEAAQGALTVDELVRRYCTFVYSQTRSYEETGRRLGVDRRTVKARIDAALLERLGNGEGA
jgi:hypothetical protein